MSGGTNQGFYESCWAPGAPGELTPEKHALSLADEAHTMIVEKYLRGQREHGGELWRKSDIIDMAIEEAVDQVIYLLTLRDQLARGDTRADERTASQPR